MLSRDQAGSAALVAALYSLLIVNVSLLPVPVYRDHVNKRQAGSKIPQVSSGPPPCIDKDGNQQFPPPKGPGFWPTDDKCHISICTGAAVITKSLCAMKGIACGAGMYLKVPAEPKSPADCCICQPYESRKRAPKDPIYFTDDNCHLSLCIGIAVTTKSLCHTKGESCGKVAPGATVMVQEFCTKSRVYSFIAKLGVGLTMTYGILAGFYSFSCKQTVLE